MLSVRKPTFSSTRPPGRQHHYASGERLHHGRYVVRAVHAVGGMSVVYRAEQRSLWQPRRTVALKVAEPRRPEPAAELEAEQRLAQEAILLRLADCWRVPRALALFEERGRLHLVMDFVPGFTLEQTLTDASLGARAPWPERSVIGLGRALADLVWHLHTGPTPILIRDLKPGNLIVTPAGHLMLVDLGIACPLRCGQLVPMAERRLGTPGYAAPEQCAGTESEDEREDLYAVGAVLYRVATGLDPARTAGQTPLPLARAVNPTVSIRMEALLAELLATDPRRRPPNASVVARRLATWEQPVEAVEAAETLRTGPLASLERDEETWIKRAGRGTPRD